jgi:hypothetical protein
MKQSLSEQQFLEPAVTTSNIYELLTNEITNKEEPIDVNILDHHKSSYTTP